MAIAELFGALEATRRREGLTEAQIAERLGIHLSTWEKIQNGTRNPGGKVLFAIMRQFPDVWNEWHSRNFTTAA